MGSTRLLFARLGLGAVALVASLAAVAVGGAAPAHALCAPPPVSDQHGSWRNINANTNSVTRVNVRNECSDHQTCDENGNCTWNGGYFVRVYGKCHPTDCDWGQIKAQDMGGGWIRAKYVRSWATNHVWLKTYTYSGTVYLRVWVHTDFTDADGRRDYTTDEWALRT